MGGFLEDVTIIRLCQVAATALVLYDHVLTLDMEIEYIWRKKWSWSKILFILNRYLCEFELFIEIRLFVASYSSESVSTIWFRIHGFLYVAVFWLASAVMILRIWALHQRSMKVLAFVLVLYLADIAGMMTAMGLTLKYISGVRVGEGTRFICAPRGMPKSISLLFVPPVVLETTLLCLAIRLAYRHFKEDGDWSASGLFRVLLGDSIFYFLISEVAFIANAAAAFYVIEDGIIAHKGGELVHWLQIPQGLAVSITCVMVCRLILNLQQAYYVPLEENYGLRSLGSGRSTACNQSDGIVFATTTATDESS